MPKIASSTGDGVRASAISVTAASTLSSSSRCHGWAGRCPTISSKASTTQVPSSYASSNRGAATSLGSRSDTAISRRWKSATAGAISEPAALMKARLPFSRRTRAASPSENPPRWLLAWATGLPSSRPIRVVTSGGIAAQSILRLPVASGRPRPGLADTSPSSGSCVMVGSEVVLHPSLPSTTA
ncbi:hypothetical protein [Streptomyces asiaticus]|uniref:hypothetical protein n=1 Tax=Streptomyces asiaticus TaxID=114695 RepID=UPI003D71A5B3